MGCKKRLLHAATTGQLTLTTEHQGFLHFLHYNIIWLCSLFAIINSFVIFPTLKEKKKIINYNNQCINNAAPHVLFISLFSINIKSLFERFVVISTLCDYKSSQLNRQKGLLSCHQWNMSFIPQAGTVGVH